VSDKPTVEQAREVLTFARELCERGAADIAAVAALLNTAYFLHCSYCIGSGAEAESVLQAVKHDYERNVLALRKVAGILNPAN
jgi:hypothetical protein